METMLSLLLPSAIKLLTQIGDNLHLNVSHDGSSVFANLSLQDGSGTTPLVSTEINSSGHITMRLFSDIPVATPPVSGAPVTPAKP